MAVQKTYKCDLCSETLRNEGDAESRQAIGLWWKDWPRGWLVKPAHECSHHICPACISSIQALPPMCGQGYECSGGPQCGGDHK